MKKIIITLFTIFALFGCAEDEKNQPIPLPYPPDNNTGGDNSTDGDNNNDNNTSPEIDNKPIANFDFTVNGNIVTFTDKSTDDYGKYSSSKLIEITHEKGSPWDMVYSENVNNIIPNNTIKEYFKNISISQPNLKKIEYIGKRDDNSKPLLLPADWDDKENYSIYL